LGKQGQEIILVGVCFFKFREVKPCFSIHHVCKEVKDFFFRVIYYLSDIGDVVQLVNVDLFVILDIDPKGVVVR
jgi:hypothetical protein